MSAIPCVRACLLPSQLGGELPFLSQALRYLCKGSVCPLMFSLLDVKPSNVLINKEGHVKMCDFGISGYLVDSVAKTMDAGCKPYMAVSVLEWGQSRQCPQRGCCLEIGLGSPLYCGRNHFRVLWASRVSGALQGRDYPPRKPRCVR